MSDEPKNENPGTSPPKPTARPDPNRGPKVPKNLGLLVLAALFAVAIIQVGRETREIEIISLNKLREKFWDEKAKSYTGLDKGMLHDESLEVKPTDQSGKGILKAPRPDSARRAELWYRIQIPPTAHDSLLLSRLETITDFSCEPSNLWFKWTVMSTLPLALVVVLFYFLVIRPLRGQGGPGNVLAFGRSRPKLANKERTGVRFDDVAGVDEAKEDVKEVIEFLRSPEKFQRLGGRIPRGLLFVGPPGTGKTLLAKAIAGEADVPFYSISGSDFVEMFVGVGASRVRDLFRQAKEHAPCIIFLDEVDAVGRRRGSGMGGGGHDEREQTLNAILVEMDGFDTSEQVIVIAATNRPDVLDPALLRPGRFDREVVISLPDVKGREQILKVHSRRVKMGEDVDLSRIARATPMFSGAELESLVNEAAIRATMAEKQFVSQNDLEEARDKVRYGREKRSRQVEERERVLTAYHEAGHAIFMLVDPDSDPLHKVTIIPRGNTGGMTASLPESDYMSYSLKQLNARIRQAFGGRLAEEIFLGDVTTGAVGDIDTATNMARRMVTEFGMADEIGPIRYSTKEQQIYLGGESVTAREHSEATAELLDKAVKRIIDTCYSQAREVLLKHRDETELIAKALLQWETLNGEEVKKILAAKSLDAITR